MPSYFHSVDWTRSLNTFGVPVIMENEKQAFPCPFPYKKTSEVLMLPVNQHFQFVVAVDQSKDFFDVCIKDLMKNTLFTGQFKSSRAGFDLLNEKIKGLNLQSPADVIIGVESTGIYHKTLLKYFRDKTYLVLELNPVQVSRFAKGNSLRKTINDSISAAYIADFILYHAADYSHYQNLAGEYLELRTLTRLILTLDDQINITKNKVKAAIQQLFPELSLNANIFTATFIRLLTAFPTPQDIVKLTRKRFAAEFNKIVPGKGRKVRLTAENLYDLAAGSVGLVNPQIGVVLSSGIRLLNTYLAEKKMIQNQVKAYASSCPLILHQIELLDSIPGIGFISAAMAIAEIGDIQRFRHKNSLTAFAGLDPKTHTSGDTVNHSGHISRMGSRYLRKIMYIISVNVARHEPHFHIWKKSKTEKYGSGKKATVSLANKLIKTFYSILSNRKPFCEERVRKSLLLKVS